MELSTSVYELSHGEVPKAHGHWFFEVIGQSTSGHRIAEIVAASGLPYAAKKAACTKFNLTHKNITIMEVIIFP
jgi:hypothetical protein